MNNHTMAAELERSTFISYHRDGVIDILIGLCLLIFGLSLAAQSPLLAAFACAPFIFYVSLKKQITYPRFGFIKFLGGSDKRRLMLASILVSGVVLIFFFLIAGIGLGFAKAGLVPSGFQTWLDNFEVLILGAAGSGIFFGAAFFSGIKRLRLFGIFFLVVIPVGLWYGIQPGELTAIIGGLILIVGIWALVFFLKENPILDEESGYVQA